MNDQRPTFVLGDAEWEQVMMRFNGVPIALFRTEGDPRLIDGWVQNPRIDMILQRWRHVGNRSATAYPDDQQLLDLMLQDDLVNSREERRTFSIKDLGEDVKLNGVRVPIIVTWDGELIDGNRRKFAVMWALSEKGGASNEQRHLLERIPMYVLPKNAPDPQRESILVQENYAAPLKKEWPPVVTNGHIYSRYQQLSAQFPDQSELQIRRLVQLEFPRYNITEIRNRINTWNLIEEFRADYGDEDNEDDLEARINNSFQYFRQANDTYRNKNVFAEAEFKELLFKGIQQELFPSFVSVRRLEEIYRNPQATEIFLGGEGLAGSALRSNFDRATAEAGRAEATRNLTLESRLESIIETIDNLTSVELAGISSFLRTRLESTLQRIIAQATVSTDEPVEADVVE